MIGKRLRSETAPRKRSNLTERPLYFYSSITRFIKPDSKCSLGWHGGSYKLLRGYPPSPQLVYLTCPSPYGEGF
jgi:hypothetical protein